MKFYLKDFSLEEAYALSKNVSSSWLFAKKSRYYKSVVDTLKGVVSKEGVKITNSVERSILWFVRSTARAIRRRANGFTISLDYRYYRRGELNPQKIGYRNTKLILDLLEKLGYIDIYIGGWRGFHKGDPVFDNSFVLFHPLYQKLWEGIKVEKIKFEPANNVVEIRDRETGESKPTRGRDGVALIKQGVVMINEFLEGANITYKGEEVVVEYRRVFIENLEMGGRFYTVGGNIQTLSQDERTKHLKIGGEPVIELDFKAAHPNMLYELEAASFGMDKLKAYLGEDFDPYGADLTGCFDRNEELIKEIDSIQLGGYDPVRNFCKMAMLVMINAKDFRVARLAISGSIGKDKQDHTKQDCLYFGLENFSVHKAINALADHNHVIEDAFFSDMGVRLMRIDSDIAAIILDKCLQANQPVISIHDSFIVKKSFQKELEKIMKDAWEEVLGSKEFCHISSYEV